MPPPRYTRPAILLHWIIAVLVLVQIALGFATDWTDRPQSDSLLGQHVRVGLLILALMALRVAWRLAHRPPPMPAAIPRWRQEIASLVYAAFYLLLVLLPVTGYILWAWTGPRLGYWGFGTVPILFTGVLWLLGRRARAGDGSPPLYVGWLLALSYLGVYSHVFLDYLNTYGVRLLTPLDWRWFYGDAVFIIDPVLWVVLGAGVSLARRSRRVMPSRVALVIATCYIAAMLIAAR